METDQKKPSLRVPLSRLEKACNYLDNKWFPCSSVILGQIDHLISQNIDTSMTAWHQELLDLIHKDYSLMLFLYKELCKDRRLEINNPEIQNLSPSDLIASSPADLLKNVLNDSMANLKLHSVEGSKEYQLQRLEEALIALITAKKLCGAEAIDPDLGAEVSLFRQIGYLLVAWNYPSIYQSAVHHIDESHSLDENLIATLGFSPTALALSLSEKWGLSRIFAESLPDREDSLLNQDETKSVARSISKMCNIGEKLARASHPEIYPTALHDWEEARIVITKSLGTEGLQIIDQAICDECEEIFVNTSFIFKPGNLSNLESRLQTFSSEQNLKRNPYINSCGEEMSKQILALYELISAGEKADRTVSILLKKILPLAGFSSSALFTIDPGTKKLALQLKAGEIKLREGSNLQNLKLRNLQDIVPLAFHSPDVLATEVKNLPEDLPSCLATFFGCSQRFGVFYVELPGKTYISNKSVYHERLKAMVFALNDCLELA